MARVTDNFVFYHIPKTGGLWVRKAMTRAGIPHHMPRGKKGGGYWLGKSHDNPSRVRDYEKRGKFAFTFVRHPLDWYKSHWSWRTSEYPPQRRTSVLDRLMKDDFDEYLENILVLFPEGFLTKLYRYYLTDEVDFVGKTESLEDDLVKALKLAGEPFDEEKLRAQTRLNVSQSDKVEISNEHTHRILESERWIIDNFYKE